MTPRSSDHPLSLGLSGSSPLFPFWLSQPCVWRWDPWRPSSPGADPQAFWEGMRQLPLVSRPGLDLSFSKTPPCGRWPPALLPCLSFTLYLVLDFAPGSVLGLCWTAYGGGVGRSSGDGTQYLRRSNSGHTSLHNDPPRPFNLALSSSLCDPYAVTGSKDYVYPHREVRAQVQGVEGQLDKGRSVAQWIITGLWIPTNV